MIDVPSPSEVRSVVDEMMTRPGFLEPEKSWFEERKEEFLESLWDFFSDAMRTLNDAVPDDGVARMLVIGWLVLTLVAIIVHFVWTLAKLRRPSVVTASGTSTSESPLEIISASAALERAARSAEDGHYDDAMAALYRGTVLWLHDERELTVDESKTGGDYARELKGERRRAFRTMLRHYYPIAFGGRVADAALWTAMRDGAAELGVPLT